MKNQHKAKHNIWRIRPGRKYVGKCEFIKNKFTKTGIIAVRFGFNKDLTRYSKDKNINTYQEFKSKSQKDKIKTNRDGDYPYQEMFKFLTQFNIGDTIVMLINKDTIIIGEITSDYDFCKKLFSGDVKDELGVHYKKVEWQTKIIKNVNKTLTTELTGSIQVPRTIVNLNKHKQEIEKLQEKYIKK